MANTVVPSTGRSVRTRGRTHLQRSVPAVVPQSIQTEPESLLGTTEAVKCSLLILRTLAFEMISPDVWLLAIRAARAAAKERKIKNSDAIISKLVEMSVQERRKNTINRAFDDSGFW